MEFSAFSSESMAMRKEAARESRLRHRQRLSLLNGSGRSSRRRIFLLFLPSPKRVSIDSWQILVRKQEIGAASKRADAVRIRDEAVEVLRAYKSLDRLIAS